MFRYHFLLLLFFPCCVLHCLLSSMNKRLSKSAPTITKVARIKHSSADLWAESCFLVEITTPEVAVLAGCYDAVTLYSDTTGPARDRTRHVTMLRVFRRDVVCLLANLPSHPPSDNVVLNAHSSDDIKEVKTWAAETNQLLVLLRFSDYQLLTRPLAINNNNNNRPVRKRGLGGTKTPPPNSQKYTKKVHTVCISKIQGSFITL